jgi:WD40 repeat protein
MSSFFDKQIDAIDACGRLIAVGLSNLEGNCWDGAVKILGMDTGEEIGALTVNSGVSSVQWIPSNDGLLLCARDDGVISVCRMDSQLELISDIEAHESSISSLSCSLLSHSLVLSASWDSSIKLWDINRFSTGCDEESSCLASLSNAHYKQTNGAAFSVNDEFMFCSCGQDGFLKIWDKRASFTTGCVTLFCNPQPLTCVAWDSLNSNRLFTGTESGSINYYDIRMNISSPQSVSPCHKARVRKIKTLAFRNNNVVVSCADDCGIHFSMNSDQASTVGASQHGRPPGLSPAVSGINSTGTVADSLQVIGRLTYHTDYVSDICIVPSSVEGNDDRHYSIISGSWDKSVRVSCFTVDDQAKNISLSPFISL